MGNPIQLCKGLHFWKNPNNKFAVLKLHYTADPDKDTPEWLAMTKAGMSESDFEREYNINFEQQAGARVFPEYQEQLNCREIELNPYLVVHRGWDFGYRRPACALTQVDTKDVWNILYEWLGQDLPLEKFAQNVLDDSPKQIKIGNDIVKIKYKDYCDPAGVQRTDKDVRSSIEILKAMGIYPMYKKSSPTERARIIRSKILMRPDGEVGLKVHPRCAIINAGFLGGYHFKENPLPGKEDDPEKDGYYDHLFDTIGYIAYHIFRYYNTEKRKTRPRYIQRKFNPITGGR